MKKHIFLPLHLLALDADIERKSRCNVLTSGVAGAFPFSSFEICDQTGIMLGTKLENRSVCMIDPFDTSKYENANISVIGMTGAGKTMLLQLMALRMRQQEINVFIIVPLKGYEYRPACEAVGGKYIKLSPSSRDCINIMEIHRATLDPDSEIGRLEDRGDSLLADKISTIHIFFTLLKPNMTDEDKNLLDEVLMKCYARFGITHDNASLFKGIVIQDDDQFSLEIALLSKQSDVPSCHIYIMEQDDADVFFTLRNEHLGRALYDH